MIPSIQQDITYTPFQQPYTVAEGAFNLTYTYGADYNRIKSELKQNGNTIQTRYYFSSFEKDGSGRYIHYVSAPVGLIAIVENSSTIHYTYTDHLGSILTVTNGNGSIEAEQNFDPWGRRRDPTSWALLAPTASTGLPDWLYRGYTGHEHLDQFGLINMNGRLYDPVLGRMLSPDNYVQQPGMTQSFNRYTYAMNNPLVYTDPDGQFWHLVIGAAIGGVLNWATHGAQFSWKGLGYFGVGAAAGALSAGIGAGVNVAMAGGSFAAGFAGTAAGVASTGFVAGVATGAAAGLTNGLISGTGNGLLGGNSFGNSLAAGLTSGVKQGMIGGLSGGILGGIDALSKGTSFWDGSAKLDMSNGVGAHGVMPEGNVIGRWKGRFEGVDVYETPELGVGYDSGGITLPGRGITVGKGVFSKNLDFELMQHEFGHVLQIRQLGGFGFLKDIGLPSIQSANKHGVNGWNHNKFWTEVWANEFSRSYFDTNYGFLSRAWNSARFPLTYRSSSDYLKVLHLIGKSLR